MTDVDAFVEHVGDTFTLVADGHEAVATLAACALTDAASGSFTLDFHAPVDDAGAVVLGQGTYVVRGHGVDAPVFLVPSGRDSAGTTLHAVFNLVAPAAAPENRTGHD